MVRIGGFGGKRLLDKRGNGDEETIPPSCIDPRARLLQKADPFETNLWWQKAAF